LRFKFKDGSEIYLKSPAEPNYPNEVIRQPVPAYGPKESGDPKDAGCAGRINDYMHYDIYTTAIFVGCLAQFASTRKDKIAMDKKLNALLVFHHKCN
jgi:hypothetical protein